MVEGDGFGLFLDSWSRWCKCIDDCWFNRNCWLTGWLNSRNYTVESLADKTVKQIDGGMLVSRNLDSWIQCFGSEFCYHDPKPGESGSRTWTTVLLTKKSNILQFKKFKFTKNIQIFFLLLSLYERLQGTGDAPSPQPPALEMKFLNCVISVFLDLNPPTQQNPDTFWIQMDPGFRNRNTTWWFISDDRIVG